MEKHLGTFRQFQILVTVYDEASVTRAAEKLFLTQPSVTMQIQKLQDTVGVELVYQHGRQIKFTSAGELIVKRARQLLTDYADLGRELQLIKDGDQGSLTLGLVTTSKYIIPFLIGDFADQYPNVDVQFNLGNRQQIIDRKVKDLDDFYVFSHPPQDPALECMPILENKFVAIAAQDHPLSSLTNLTLQHLCQAPLLVREPGSGTRLSMDEYFSSQHLSPNIRMTIESNEAIKHAVISGLGVAILSEHVIRQGGNEGLKILNIEGFSLRSRWYLVYRRTRPLSPAANNLLTLIQNSLP